MSSSLTTQLLVCKNSVCVRALQSAAEQSLKFSSGEIPNCALFPGERWEFHQLLIAVSSWTPTLFVPPLLFCLLLLLVLTGSPEKLCWDSVIFLDSFTFCL